MIELIQDDKNGFVLGDMMGKPVHTVHYVELTRKDKETKALIKMKSSMMIDSEIYEMNLVKKDGNVIKSPELYAKDPEIKDAYCYILYIS